MKSNEDWSRENWDGKNKKKKKRREEAEEGGWKKKEEKTKKEEDDGSEKGSKRVENLRWGGEGGKVWRRGQEISSSKVPQVDLCF